MSESGHDKTLTDRIVASLDAGCARLDEATRRRLDRARRAALADEARVEWRRRPGRALPAAAAAAVVVLALVVAIGVNPPAGERAAGPAIEPPPRTADLDLLTREDFELFTEDPGFYAWLARLPQQREDAEQSG